VSGPDHVPEGERAGVFVTVGTDHHPFDRLISWMDAWQSNGSNGAESFIQYGTSRAPTVAAGQEYVSHDEMERLIASAGAIVCHGGPGTIVDCMRSGIKPIVVPRRHAFGEHVDDHQVRFARRLEAAGYIKVADDERELGSMLRAALDGSPDFVAPQTGDVVRETVSRFTAMTAPLLPRRDVDRFRVLYIGGWGRSGSTLLDRLLGQANGSFSVGEMRDLWLRGVLENRRCGCGEPFDRCPFWTEVGREAFGGWSPEHATRLHALRMRYDRPWTLPMLSVRRPWSVGLERYAEATAEVYRAVKKVSGAEVIIDSTKIPSYAFLLRRVSDIDLRFVHLVRDSRGVVYSWQKSIDRPDGTSQTDRMIRYGAASAGGRYVLYNASARLLRTARVPYLFTRYEDLVADPEAELRRVLRFAELPEALDFLHGETASLQPNHTVDGNPMRFASGPLVIKGDEAWRTQMDARDRRLVTAITGPLLRRYGYETGGDTP
jgi:UDP-N-acetylglucosamine transferase subunit ALG13